MNILQETKDLSKRILSLLEESSMYDVENFEFGSSARITKDLFKDFLTRNVYDWLKYNSSPTDSLVDPKDVKIIAYRQEDDEYANNLRKKFDENLNKFYEDCKKGLYHTISRHGKNAKNLGYYLKKIYLSEFTNDSQIRNMIFFAIVVWENAKRQKALNFIFLRPRVFSNQDPSNPSPEKVFITSPETYLDLGYQSISTSDLFEIQSKSVAKNILNKKPTEVLPEEIFQEIDGIIMWVLSVGSAVTFTEKFKDKVKKSLEHKFEDTIKSQKVGRVLSKL